MFKLILNWEKYYLLKDSSCNLFANNHQQINDKQHFMLIYSGKDRLESLTFNKLILQDNKATMQFIKILK